MTRHLYAHNPHDMQHAEDLLRQGEIVAVPTETVYGLAADAKNPKALEKIFQAKNRPCHHPLIVHISHETDLSYWASQISLDAQKLCQALWPGPLTLLLPKSPHVHPLVTGGSELIALRAPNHPVIRHLLSTLDTGLAAPSANTHLRTSPTTAEHVLTDLSGKIPAVLDGGPCTWGLESTIVDFSGDTPCIVRHGPITVAMIEPILGKSVPSHQHQYAPGSLPIHYRPLTPTYLVTTDQRNKLQQESLSGLIVIICHSSYLMESPMIRTIPMPLNAIPYGAHLYAALHTADACKPLAIFVERPPEGPEWMAIHDRLGKAATLWSCDSLKPLLTR